jgi:hypothetical protein
MAATEQPACSAILVVVMSAASNSVSKAAVASMIDSTRALLRSCCGDRLVDVSALFLSRSHLPQRSLSSYFHESDSCLCSG